MREGKYTLVKDIPLGGDEKIKAGTNNVKVVVTDGVGNSKTLKMKVVY